MRKIDYKLGYKVNRLQDVLQGNREQVLLKDK